PPIGVKLTRAEPYPEICIGLPGEILRVTKPHGFAFAHRGALLLAELADGLQHAVAHGLAGPIGRYQRLPDQRIEHVEHVEGVVATGAYPLRSLQREPAREHRGTRKNSALLGRQKVERPLYVLAQRLVPG